MPKPIPSINILGALPPDLQTKILYATGIGTVAKTPTAAVLANATTAGSAAPIIRKNGMEPF